jgi:PAS domain S-box-containing protein
MISTFGANSLVFTLCPISSQDRNCQIVTRNYSELKFVCSVAGFFALLLLVVFITELAVMNLFSSLFQEKHPAFAALLDASALVLLFSVPLWYFVIRPLILDHNFDRLEFRKKSVSLFVQSLGVIFLAELLIMLVLPQLLPHVDKETFAFADAGLLILLCTPFLYCLLIRPYARNRRLLLYDLSIAPLKLYVLLLFGVFLADLLDDTLIAVLAPHEEMLSHKLTDSFIFTMIAAPLLWLLMMRPLERAVLREKTRYLAVQAQVIDAIMTLDANGVIESFNPAAERIFGYKADEIIGKCSTQLLCNDQQCLDALLEADACQNGLTPRMPCEVSGRRSDGSVLAMEVSVSKIRLSGREISLVIIRDISDRKKTESDLQKSLSLLNATLESTADGILVIDNERRVQTFNQKFLDLWGFSRETVENANSFNLFPLVKEQLQDPDALITRMAELCRKQENTVQDIIRFNDGRVYEVYSQSRVLEGSNLGRVWSFRDITAKTKVEDALRVSDERYNIAVNGANDGIWDWNIPSGAVYYSLRLRELLGFDADEMGDVIESFESLLHPEDHDRVMKAVDDHLTLKVPYDTEYRLRTGSGNYLWFRARGQAVWDESGKPVRMAGSISDITRRKEAEAAVRESMIRFRQIFEQAEQAIIFFKPGTCSIIDVNLSAEELYGYSKAELKDVGVERLLRPEDFSTLKNFIAGIRSGEMSCLENLSNFKKDGEEIIVTVCGKVMTLQGIAIIYCSFRDVTERVRMEEKARDIQARLIQANKMTSLGLLVSGVAHEINNPNNFIMVNAQLLDRTWHDALKVLREYYRENGDYIIGGIPFSQMDSQAEQLFAGVIDGSRRINEIVANLKSFARQERNVADRAVDVNHVVSAAVSFLHHELSRYTEKFQLDLMDDIPHIIGSNQQIGQVIINLLLNACQALPDKQHGIQVATGYDAAADMVTITVRDEGSGMSKEIGNRIMEPFFTTKLDAGGTGLGLSISQSIIKDHEGCLEFDSIPGVGTTFVVKIPAAKPVTKEHHE